MYVVSFFVIGLGVSVNSVAAAESYGKIAAVLVNVKIDIVKTIGKHFFFGSKNFCDTKTEYLLISA